QYNAQLSTLSKQVAKQMARYPSFRAYVKEKTGERFDGDYNFLLERHLQDVVEPEKTVQEILLEGVERQDEMLSFLQSYKQLQLAVPHGWAVWNGKDPLSTVFIPADYEEHLAKTVQGFSPAGFPVQLSTLEEPLFPVVVLGQNERTDVAGQLLPIYGPIEGSGGIGPFGGNISNGGGNISNGGGSTCYGDDGDWQYIASIRASNLNALEHWVCGAPEVRFVVKRNDDLSLLNGEMGAILIPDDRDDVNEVWDTFNATLFRWYNEESGTPLVGNNCVFFVSEKDNGTWFTTPLNLGITTANGLQIGVTFHIELTDKDEWIGTVPVYFEDCNFFEYNPGTLQFKLKRI
ncbi:MAG: hypothetical protein AAGH79_19425, partial [Bacteroidota bacterium]